MSSPKIPKEEYFEYRNLGPLLLGLAGGGMVALLIVIAGIFVAPKQFAFSWLAAFIFFFTLLVGSFFWVLLHYAVEAEWSVVVRRILENVSSLFKWFWIAFIPIIFFHDKLYYWMTLLPGEDPLLDDKAAFLNQPFFWARAVFYFLFFGLVALLYRSMSVRQDSSGDPWITARARGISFVTLPVFAVSITLAGIDWLMALDHHWFSTMWGVYIFAGSALGSICLLVIIVTALRNVGYLKEVVTLEHYHVMGKLMLAFTIFWAYIAFGQYFLIWYANIPEETVWFIKRNVETWNGLSIFLVIGHFFIPFLILLFQPIKKNPAVLSGVAAWILFMHFVDVYIVVMPVMHPFGFSPSIFDIAAFVAIGAPLALLFLQSLGKSALFPVRDPRLAKSIAVTN